MPMPMSVALDIYDHNRLDSFSAEDNMVSFLITKQSVEKLKDFLTEDEFDLLWARFVEGKTVRELEPEMGIAAASIVVRTKNILKRLERNKKRILKYEGDTDIKETESGHSS
jgi:hypothetical protein